MMKKIAEKIKSDFCNKQFVIFLAIGIVNTLGGSLYAIAFSVFFQENVSFILGYILALLIAYVLNSRFAFRTKMTWPSLIKFVLSYVPNFIIQNVVVVLLFNLLRIPYVFVFFVAAMLGIPVTFLLLKYYAFRQNKRKEM